MSPVSRRRKTQKRAPKPRDPVLFAVPTPEPCTCPDCTGVATDPALLIDGLLQSTRDLAYAADPLDAELVGSSILSVRGVAGDEFAEAMVYGFLPAIEERATANALALLLAVGSAAGEDVAKSATVAADRLMAAGIRAPRWADGLTEPVTSANHRRLNFPEAALTFLGCEFRRGRRSHALLIHIDDEYCGAAADIALLDGADLDDALDSIMTDVRSEGGKITLEELDAAEFRWQAENALDARREHDEDDRESGTVEDSFDDDDGPGYHALAALLRTRLDGLPKSSKPPIPHSDVDAPGLESIAELIKLLDQNGGPFRFAGPVPRRAQIAKLPPKRKKSDGPAPVFQIKVGLAGAKPPIWRRLEVPADITLAKLHTAIQIAFGWEDCHLHVFETEYGEFGDADPEFGRRSEKPVTLEQVADGVTAKLRYTYDFGDYWRHDIVVEKVLERDPKASYPRCTAGRRAAPPEDCGGIWGYADLVDILADADHPEHEDRLEWLGLGSSAEFDPPRFDTRAVTEALTALR